MSRLSLKMPAYMTIFFADIYCRLENMNVALNHGYTEPSRAKRCCGHREHDDHAAEPGDPALYRDLRPS
ncbi:hypothetical protein DESC_370207 [Desulfosarcina cetonica]|nr:hypothetical protein DESC_370207 [Desulfosarcina cetonica]